MNPLSVCSRSLLVLGVCLSLASRAAVPAPEKLLPDDTLAVATAPDFSKLREIYRASAQSRLWNDPAMKPFRDKFVTKWREDFVEPLERELGVSVSDYTALLQGQVTFAVAQNGSEKDAPGMVLLVDSRDKSSQLKTNLAALRKKLVDSGKSLRTEKIRNVEFSIVSVSSNDLPKTLRKFMPQHQQVQELESENDSKKPSTSSEWVFGQVDSLLIVAGNTKAAEAVVARLTGGNAPSLSQLAAYDTDHQALFRNAPLYAWVNVKAFVDLLKRETPEKKGDDAPDPLGNFSIEKIVTATGFGGLKTLALVYQTSNEGSLFQVFLGVPEANRQGIFKILGGEPKDSTPPAFVPADAVKFRRWRVDGQKAWATLEKMLADISPQLGGYLNFALDTANTAAKEKDPGFDVKKSFIGNLGDDMISYEKAPRETTQAGLQSPPSLYLLGSPHADELAAAFKSILGVLNQGGNPPSEREFLGHKIVSLPVPALPLPIAAGPKPSTPRTLNYATSGGYVALSTDVSMLEEFLRSSDSQGKSLREIAGLTEAAQKVKGPATGFFGYNNQLETMRTSFELMKKSPSSSTSSAPLAAVPGLSSLQTAMRDWLDFSLLPSFDRISKYFTFMVYGGSSSAQGLTLKVFTPAPPQLRGSKD